MRKWHQQLPSEFTSSVFAQTFSKWTQKYPTKAPQPKIFSLYVCAFSPLSSRFIGIMYWTSSAKLDSLTVELIRKWNGFMFFTNSSSLLIPIYNKSSVILRYLLIISHKKTIKQVIHVILCNCFPDSTRSFSAKPNRIWCPIYPKKTKRPIILLLWELFISPPPTTSSGDPNPKKAIRRYLRSSLKL